MALTEARAEQRINALNFIFSGLMPTALANFRITSHRIESSAVSVFLRIYIKTKRITNMRMTV